MHLKVRKPCKYGHKATVATQRNCCKATLKMHKKNEEVLVRIFRVSVSCDSATEGRTCGAWWIREPGYTCS